MGDYSMNFPTIKQMEEAVLFAMSDNNGKCEYHQDTHTFIATELIPYPVRDDGGSIDSVGYREEIHNISFQEAYHYWLAMIEFIEGKVQPIPAPVMPRYSTIEYEDEELPF